jgi:hypothetical protein
VLPSIQASLFSEIGEQVQEMQESIDCDAKTLVGELEPGKPKTTVRDSKMLVTSSGESRDKLRLLVRSHLDEKVSILEPEYQPFKI